MLELHLKDLKDRILVVCQHNACMSYIGVVEQMR